jgi:dihydroorotate dehydrogenase
MLAKLRRIVGPDFVLVGVGGIDSAETAFAKIAAGANLVQLYTGMVYEGPGLAAEIVRGLSAACDRLGLETLADAVGGETDRWLNPSAR